MLRWEKCSAFPLAPRGPPGPVSWSPSPVGGHARRGRSYVPGQLSLCTAGSRPLGCGPRGGRATLCDQRSPVVVGLILYRLILKYSVLELLLFRQYSTRERTFTKECPEPRRDEPTTLIRMTCLRRRGLRIRD